MTRDLAMAFISCFSNPTLSFFTGQAASISVFRRDRPLKWPIWATNKRRLSPVMQSEIGEQKYPEDYDRDYYDELKAKYGHLDNIEIFSKDDYEIDPRDTPWLGDDSGIDVDELRRKVAASSVLPDELDVAPDRPFRHTDLHSPEEVANYGSSFREADAASGRFWEDPMPDSDFDGDEQWIDLRKVDVASTDALDGDVFAGAFPKPLERKQYSSAEEEFAAILESADRMQAENLDQPIPKTAWGEAVPEPDSDDFEKWQRAAEERGGNSTRGESNFLPPAKKVERSQDSASWGSKDGLFPPRQRQSLIESHVGSWTGDLAVFSISAASFHFKQERSCPVKSRTSICSDGGLEWSSVVSAEGLEMVSDVHFAPVDHADALIPGRGVWSDGSFVQNSPRRGSSQKSSVYADISIGEKFLQAVTGNKNCKSEIELCMVFGNGSHGWRRDRVILCSDSSFDDSGSRKSVDRFAFVVLLHEYQPSSTDRENSLLLRTGQGREAMASVESMRGDWAGKGILLHPEFVMHACREVFTRLRFSTAERITDKDVTWVEDEFRDDPEVVSRGRQRTLAKKKVSKRVAAARAYDQRRLSECSILCCEETGHAKPETHAWKAIPSVEGFTSLFSPRVGKFAADYCGLVLRSGLMLTFPFGKAFPDMWNTIGLIELSKPVRKRIAAGRNEYGDLLGVLLVNESVTDEELCDDAASYV